MQQQLLLPLSRNASQMNISEQNPGGISGVPGVLVLQKLFSYCTSYS